MELPEGISIEKVLALIEKDKIQKEKFKQIAQKPERKAYARVKAMEYYTKNKEAVSQRRKELYKIKKSLEQPPATSA
jgi:hypothetical protein